MSKRYVEIMGKKTELKRGKIPFYEAGKPPRSDLIAEIDYLDELKLIWGEEWGGQGLGKLRRAMVTRPSDFEDEIPPEARKDPEYWFLPPNLRTPADAQYWREAHDDLIKTLKGEGIGVEVLEFPLHAAGPYCRLRDVVFAAWTMIIHGGAIIPKFGLGAWLKGIEVYLAKKLLEIGCPILYTVHGKGCLEPGPSNWLDYKHFLTWISATNNSEGINQILPVLQRAGVEETHVAHLPGWPLAFHLDMIFATVGLGLAVAFTDLMDYETIKYLRQKKIELIEVPREEAYKPYVASNVLILGPGKVLVTSGSEQTARAIRKRGIDVVETKFFQPRCAVAPLVRDMPGPLLEELGP